jgi:hypothetical protein
MSLGIISRISESVAITLAVVGCLAMPQRLSTIV